MEGGSESYTVIRERNQIGSAHRNAPGPGSWARTHSLRTIGHPRPLFSESRPIRED